LQQALDSACRNSCEDLTKDHVEDSPTASLFGANLGKPTGEMQQAMMLNCRSPLALQDSLTAAANKPQSGDICVDLNQNTNKCDDLDKHWTLYNLNTPSSPQSSNDAPREIYNEFMGIDNEQSIRDTVTASSSAESDASG
jgi:hypothetical protein